MILLTCMVLATLIQPVSAQTVGPCQFNPLIVEMLSATNQARWTGWIRQLSGLEPVTIQGQTTLITSRHTRRMFNGDPSARAYDYVLEILNSWLGERARIEQDRFLVYKPPEEIYNGMNLIVDLPGQTRPDEIVILAAHLDSLAARVSDPAPGADDNATGVAALLEAANAFRNYSFERTIRFIFFTGEEQIEVGSKAYLADHTSKGIVGVFNLDMIGYDSDHDRCFEIHAGTLPASLPLAQCVKETIQAYQLNLTPEVFTYGSSWDSDHATFWAYQIPTVLLWENYIDPIHPDDCHTFDRNPFYHTSNDLLDQVNPDTGFAISQAGMASAALLAGPLGRCETTGCPSQTSLKISPESWRYWRSRLHYVPMQ